MSDPSSPPIEMQTSYSRHDLIRIANCPTTLSRKQMQEYLASNCKGVHESVLRAYQILAKVRGLLEIKTPPEVVLELIALMESDDCQPYAWHEAKYNEAKNV